MAPRDVNNNSPILVFKEKVGDYKGVKISLIFMELCDVL